MNISVCTMKLKKQHLQGWRVDSMIKSACLQRSGVWVPVSKYNNSQQPVTPAPRDLTPPSDYQGNCTYVCKLHIQTHTHIIRHKRCLRNRNGKLFILLKLCQRPPGYLCLLLLYCLHHHFIIHAHPSPMEKVSTESPGLVSTLDLWGVCGSFRKWALVRGPQVIVYSPPWILWDLSLSVS